MVKNLELSKNRDFSVLPEREKGGETSFAVFSARIEK